jgi:hypothetical protein
MALAETGTRALPGAAFGSTAASELDWARQLLRLPDKTMLVLMDRGFDAGDFLAEVAGTGAQFLVRLNASRRPPVLRHLPDGSFTSVIGGVKVRVIAAEVAVTCHDGTSYGGWYRLATTLLDHRAFPAARLMALYHERWEHEVAFLALRHTLLQGRVLRSGDLAGSIGRAVLTRLNPPAGPESAPAASSLPSAAGTSTHPENPPPARKSPRSPAGPSPPTTNA